VPGSKTPRAARAPTPSEALPRRRHGHENHRPEAAIVTNTLELLITVLVSAASRQDRDGATPVLPDAYLATPVRFVFADAACAGRLRDWARHMLATTAHLVRKPTDQRGSAVIPRRWAVERTFAWITAPSSEGVEAVTRSDRLR
jgi:transposase